MPIPSLREIQVRVVIFIQSEEENRDSSKLVAEITMKIYVVKYITSEISKSVLQKSRMFTINIR